MASSMIGTDRYSLKATRLIHLNRRNGTELLRRCVVGQFRLPSTTVFGRSLSVRSSSSIIPAISAVRNSEAKVIDGKDVAETIRDEVAIEVIRLKDSIGKVPHIPIINFDDRKDSPVTYVKKKAFRSVGIEPVGFCIPTKHRSEEEVLKRISNINKLFSGVIFQLPLPSHLDEEKIFNAVSIEKDVEGFQFGMSGREPLFPPCTPNGCIELLRRYNVEMKGKRAVVIGTSKIVGMPAALLLQREGAMVSIIHSRTKNPEEITREADIIISAVGQPNLVRGSWIKKGAVIIDVGINIVEDLNAFRGYRLVGDICYEEACKIASAITPVPGGVAPMTIAMLLSNTLTAAKTTGDFSWPW